MLSPELCGTLMSYAAPYWATLHTTKLCCIQLSDAAPYLTCAAHYLNYTLHPLSFAAPFCATLHPSELRCTLRATLHPLDKLRPFELCCTLLSYAAPYWATLHAPYWATRRPKWATRPTHRSFADPLFFQARTRAAIVVDLSTGPKRLWYILFPAPRPIYRTLVSCSAP